jgi:A/G-specific adenine glycosylase
MLQTRKIKQMAAGLLEWFAANARDLPWRRSKDPYSVFISEIMLQQTQVKTVIPYFERWMKELPTVGSFAKARPQKVLKLWEGLGYYSRVRNAQAAARIVMERHGGAFPRGFEDILALPGIGRYTAGAISSIAFNEPTPILDGNVMRVLCRFFGVGGNPREKKINATLWKMAEKLAQAAPGRCSDLNQSLMELGALVCTPRQPRCPECPLNRLCFAQLHGRVAEFPMAPPRVRMTERRFVAFVAQKGDRFMVRQRPEGAVNASLWEFPNVEVQGEWDKSDGRDGFRVLNEEAICLIRHSITRYRITLEAYWAGAKTEAPGAWRTLPELRRLPFAAAHRKILLALEKMPKKARTFRNGPL